MSKKRVVITGLSAISPLGCSHTESWENLIAGKSGIGPLTNFDASEYPTRIAAEVGGFSAEAFGISVKQVKRMDRFTQFAVAC